MGTLIQEILKELGDLILDIRTDEETDRRLMAIFHNVHALNKELEGVQQFRAAEQKGKEDEAEYSGVLLVAETMPLPPPRPRVADTAKNTEKAEMGASVAPTTPGQTYAAAVAATKKTAAHVATNTGKTGSVARATTTPRLTDPTVVPSTLQKKLLPRTNAVVIHGVRTG